MRKNKCLWPIKNTNIYFPGIDFTFVKAANNRIHMIMSYHIMNLQRFWERRKT